MNCRDGAGDDGGLAFGRCGASSVDTQFRYLYKSTGGAFVPVASLAEVPVADVAMTTTTAGQSVPFVVRLEREPLT